MEVRYCQWLSGYWTKGCCRSCVKCWSTCRKIHTNTQEPSSSYCKEDDAGGLHGVLWGKHNPAMVDPTIKLRVWGASDREVPFKEVILQKKGWHEDEWRQPLTWGVCIGAGNLPPVAGHDSALWVPSAQQLPSSASSPLGFGRGEQHKSSRSVMQPLWQLFISYDAFLPDHDGEQLLQFQWITLVIVLAKAKPSN